jgi:8-oxo-dGTP diphosphatase
MFYVLMLSGRIPQKVFRSIMKYSPILAVDGIIEVDKGVVLVKRDIDPFKGYWHLPGGIVRKGESVHEAFKRKMLEETGLYVEILKLVGIYDDPQRDPRGHWISLCFLAKVLKGSLRGSEQGREVRIFSKLPQKIGFDHRKMLNDAGYT